MVIESYSGSGLLGGNMEIKLVLKESALEKPKESGEYLCYIDGEWIVLHYSSIHKKFNCFDAYNKYYAKKNEIKITYWAELPNL